MNFENPIVSQVIRTVHCQQHGDNREAFVCEHLLHGSRLGFFSDLDDPSNPYPDAWCSSCERIKVEHGGWTDESHAVTKIRLICGQCYEEIKAKNILGTEGSSKRQ